MTVETIIGSKPKKICGTNVWPATEVPRRQRQAPGSTVHCQAGTRG
jgi:hypothetical protein